MLKNSATLFFGPWYRKTPFTDAIWSPRLERNIGYVWVPREFSEPGVELDVRMPDGVATGRTAAIRFVDPEKRTPLR
jgi:glycine cleavage system aminomethyltransferase T